MVGAGTPCREVDSVDVVRGARRVTMVTKRPKLTMFTMFPLVTERGANGDDDRAGGIGGRGGGVNEPVHRRLRQQTKVRGEVWVT